MRLDFGRTGRAAPARGVARVAPGDDRRVRPAFGDDAGEARAAVEVHRQDVAQPVHAVRSVAEHEPHLLRRRDPEPVQLVAIRGELKQRGDLRRSGQLGVLHLVDAVAGVHDEVGESEEAAVEEGGLENHVRARRERHLGRGGSGSERPGSAQVGPRDLDHAGPEARPVLPEHPLLVGVAEARGALEHGIRFLDDARAAAELHVERAQEGELAVGGGGQVARARDDAVFEQEHRCLPVGSSKASRGLRHPLGCPSRRRRERPHRPGFRAARAGASAPCGRARTTR